DELDRVKESIGQQLAPARGDDSIRRLVVHLNTCGGKMIRPALVLLSGKAVGKVTDEHIRVAAILEVIHNATLLHDDVIDEGQKRRGSPTVNNLWGNEAAVLLGDFLLSRVFKMCADLRPQVSKIIAATAARICEGELRQIVQRQNGQLSESEYIDIITEKSAALFSSCCHLGGLLAGASEVQIRSLSDFGLNTGIAFQITDDLLDIIGDEGKTGKTLGSDVDKDKLTLAVIHLFDAVDGREKRNLRSKLSAWGENKKLLVEALRSHGSLEYAHSRAQEFVAKAIELLAGLKESDSKDALIEIAGFVADRAAVS
ncbi:MAG: polyprenyl synthetase family protein, partial [Planctomycetota bacterium]